MSAYAGQPAPCPPQHHPLGGEAAGSSRCPAALASVQLRTGMHLGGLDLGFPATSSEAVRRAAMLNFAGFGRVVVAEMDVDDILQRAVDPALDGPA